MSRVGGHSGSEGAGVSAEELTDIGPESAVAGLDEEELAALSQVGERWGRALGPRRAWLRACQSIRACIGSHAQSSRAVAVSSRRSTLSTPTTRLRSWLHRTPARGPRGRGAPHRCGVGWRWAHRCRAAPSLPSGCASWSRCRSFHPTPSPRLLTDPKRCWRCSRSPAAARWASRWTSLWRSSC